MRLEKNTYEFRKCTRTAWARRRERTELQNPAARVMGTPKMLAFLGRLCLYEDEDEQTPYEKSLK